MWSDLAYVPSLWFFLCGIFLSSISWTDSRGTGDVLLHLGVGIFRIDSGSITCIAILQETTI